jgi:hypothetical protein
MSKAALPAHGCGNITGQCSSGCRRGAGKAYTRANGQQHQQRDGSIALHLKPSGSAGLLHSLDHLIKCSSIAGNGAQSQGRSGCRRGHLGICDQGTATRIMWLLQKFGLPIFPDNSPAELAEAALSDKKRTGDTVNLILPEKVGSCAIVPTPVSELESIMQAGL